MDKIVITSWKLSDENAYSPDTVKDNPELENAITEYAENRLTPNGIEIFKRDKNIVITESGCYGAFFESDLEKI